MMEENRTPGVTVQRIFMSYGHDEYGALAERIRADLEARGHEVWFDKDQLRPGVDWEARIEQGLAWIAELAVFGLSRLLS